MFNNYISSNVEDNEELNKVLKSFEEVNYNAFYRAYVVDNNDVDKLGKVKVRIPVLHGFTSKNPNFVDSNALPWASPAIFPSGGNDSGAFLVPNVGDTVYVTFEADSPKLPIYFGGIPSKIGDNEKKISSVNINKNEPYTYNDDDYIKDIVNGTERVIYKSLKGATIIIDDYDSNEYIKIIDQAGQEVTMENFRDDSLNRRGNKLGLSSRSKMTLTNNQGDKVTLKNGKVYIQSDTISIETKSIDIPGINRDFWPEDALINQINGDSPIMYEPTKASNALVYQDMLDEIIGNRNYKAKYKEMIEKAIQLTNEISNEVISTNDQTDFSKFMYDISSSGVNIVNGEIISDEIDIIDYIVNIFQDNTYIDTMLAMINRGDYLTEEIVYSLLDTGGIIVDGTLDISRLRLPNKVENEFQVFNVYFNSGSSGIKFNIGLYFIDEAGEQICFSSVGSVDNTLYIDDRFVLSEYRRTAPSDKLDYIINETSVPLPYEATSDIDIYTTMTKPNFYNSINLIQNGNTNSVSSGPFKCWLESDDNFSSSNLNGRICIQNISDNTISNIYCYFGRIDSSYSGEAYTLNHGVQINKLSPNEIYKEDDNVYLGDKYHYTITYYSKEKTYDYSREISLTYDAENHSIKGSLADIEVMAKELAESSNGDVSIKSFEISNSGNIKYITKFEIYSRYLETVVNYSSLELNIYATVFLDNHLIINDINDIAVKIYWKEET